MDLSTVIAQIRANCPIFQSRVGGAADYSTGLETTTNLPMPAAYVYPLEDDPSDNENAGWSLRQLVEEKIAVVVCLDNSPDRRGQAAATSVESIKYDLFAAILNWNPSGLPRAAQGLRYGGGHLLGFDRARLWWQFEFALAATITEDDGFIVTGESLQEIDLTIPVPHTTNVIFDTLDYGVRSGSSGVATDGSTLCAQSFTTAAQRLGEVSLVLTASNPTDGARVLFYLIADDGSGGGPGVPGQPDLGIIQTIGSIEDSSLSSDAITITLEDLPIQVSNRNNVFWMVCDFNPGGNAQSSAQWLFNQDATGTGTANQAGWTDEQVASYPIDGTGAQGPFALAVSAQSSPVSSETLSIAITGLNN